VEPDCTDFAFACGEFQTTEEFAPNSPAARFREYFQCLDVCGRICGFGGPVDYAETEHAGVALGYPDGGIALAGKLAHISTTEALGRLETDFFNGVKCGEVLGAIEAIEHMATLTQHWAQPRAFTRADGSSFPSMLKSRNMDGAQSFVG